SKESAEERRRFIRDADNLVRRLTIEFEIELGLGSTVVPVGKKLELAPPKAPLRERGASDGDAHARRFPVDPAFLCDRFGRGDDAACDETWPALVLAREDEDRIAFGDVLATIHRLLRAERERLRPRIANLGFDREHHSPHLAPLISMAVHAAAPAGWAHNYFPLKRPTKCLPSAYLMSEIFQPVFVRTREKVISVLWPMFSNEAITSAESFSDLDFRSENFLMSKSCASQRGSASRAPTSPFDFTASFQISCAK